MQHEKISNTWTNINGQYQIYFLGGIIQEIFFNVSDLIFHREGYIRVNSVKCFLNFSIDIILIWQSDLDLYHTCARLISHCKFVSSLAVQNSSIGDLVTDWLSDFLFWHYRVTLETCDLWDIWSEWWGDLILPPTYLLPTYLPTYLPVLENTLKAQS